MRSPSQSTLATLHTSAAVAARAPHPLMRLAAAAALATALTLGAAAHAQAVAGQPATGITVSGNGAAYGEPDQAVVNLGVDATSETVREALDEADATMHAIREAALALGIEQRDIRTVSFNVWRQQMTDRDGQPTGERYHVQHAFQVTVRDAEQVGALLSAAIEAGANDVGGINFTISDTAELQSRAREAAMDDALARAQELAALAGLTLGSPVHIEETSYNAPMPAATMDFSRAVGSPVESGQLAVNVTVRVTYALAPSEPAQGN